MKRVGFTLLDFTVVSGVAAILLAMLISAVSRSKIPAEQSIIQEKSSSSLEGIGRSAFSSGVTVSVVTVDGHKLAVATGSQCVSIIELKDDHAAKAEDE
jgi:hypothetical protein